MTSRMDEELEHAIAAAKRDPHGGKVLLPLDVAEDLLAALKQRRQ